MKKKFEFTVVFRGDLDMVPGAYHQVQDWINLACGPNSMFVRQKHYNTEAEVISIKEERVPHD